MGAPNHHRFIWDSWAPCGVGSRIQVYRGGSGVYSDGRLSELCAWPASLACKAWRNNGRAGPSGAWQKYPYRWRHGIIGAKKSPGLPKGVSYAHRHGAIPHGLPPGAANGTTTGLLGADCTPADESPAAGT